MDSGTEIVTDLIKSPETFKKLLLYFQNLTKNPKFTANDLATLKPSQIIPHLIVFIEANILDKGIEFIDILFYTNYNLFTPDYKTLQYKAILVWFRKNEKNDYNYLVF